MIPPSTSWTAAGWVVLAAALLAGCGSPAAEPAVPGGLPVPPGAQVASVVRAVDGDTVVLRGESEGPLPARPTKVRLLEIDAPEVFEQPECFGPEAAKRVGELLRPGARVRVEADRDLTDRYGRMLLYVWTDAGTSVQEALVADGFARTVLFRPNDRYIDELRAVEAAARAADRGLWGACPDPPKRR